MARPPARAVGIGPLQALDLCRHLPTTHLPTCIHLSNTSNPPGGEKFLVHTLALNFRRKITGPHLRPDPRGLYSSSSPRPRAFRPYAAVVLCVHLTSPSRPVAILPLWPHLPKGSVKNSLVSAWGNVGGLPGLRIWSPLREKSARTTTQSTGSATGRQTY